MKWGHRCQEQEQTQFSQKTRWSTITSGWQPLIQKIILPLTGFELSSAPQGQDQETWEWSPYLAKVDQRFFLMIIIIGHLDEKGCLGVPKWMIFNIVENLHLLAMRWSTRFQEVTFLRSADSWRSSVIRASVTTPSTLQRLALTQFRPQVAQFRFYVAKKKPEANTCNANTNTCKTTNMYKYM